MNAEELIKSIIAHGGDEAGIRDRFKNNAELYELCFRDLIEEPNFGALKDSLSSKNFNAAFEAAHALKGLSGNLGLTAFYEAICSLVESLRAGSYEGIDEQYAVVQRQLDALKRIYFGELPQPDNSGVDISTGKTKKAKKSHSKPSKKNVRFILMSISAVFSILVLVGLLFRAISINFRENIVKESGQHLTEMSDQIRLYVEEQVANDWRVAMSVGDSITDSGFADGDSAILSMLQRKKNVWGVSDLLLYTESGYSIYADGTVEDNDIASDTVVRAREHQRYLTVIDSKLIYTMPIYTQTKFNGSRIVAVSVVQDMRTFLDDMNFSAFDGKAWMYLTEENGIVISMLTNESAVQAFNFKALIKNANVTPLSDSDTAAGLFSSEDSSAFLMTAYDKDTYIVSSPVSTGDAPLKLFFLAPENVVNNTMNGFSLRLTIFSMIMIALFGILAFFAFLVIYRSRKKLFDIQLSNRERMFDLLVQNTQTAFALFKVDEAEPSYISSNIAEVVGDAYWVIEKYGSDYRMRNNSGADSATIHQANEMLRGWDGKSTFRSDYIKNNNTVSPSWFNFQLYPIGEDGTDFVCIAQDVTQVWEREQVTKNAMEMATRSNEAKSKFLSNMSHDIRTPMNAIMNISNFALESIDQPKKLGPYLRTIHESSEHLLHLINDVLDMSRIESGQTVLASAPFDIKEEMQRQSDMIQPLCIAKDQTLITDFSGLSSTQVQGDALKLSQVIINLLSNAVKFTPRNGAVRFTAREIPSLREDIADIRFVIEDNGIGISENDIERIFDPFCRVDDKRVGRTEGTGLGLSICKSYVEAMGGSIRCESEEGEGSTFTVELFFKKTHVQVSEDVSDVFLGNAPFLGMRCLVAEDNATNRLIAKTLLERAGFITDFACDGLECLSKFMKSKADEYDVIYMDIRMPVMDGYQAAAQIRVCDHPQARQMPIVAMTANVFAEDIEKARLAGMDAFIGKPIVSFELVEQTNKAIEIKKRNRK